jgi:hypothetical protein
VGGGELPPCVSSTPRVYKNSSIRDKELLNAINLMRKFQDLFTERHQTRYEPNTSVPTSKLVSIFTRFDRSSRYVGQLQVLVVLFCMVMKNVFKIWTS